MDTITLTSEQVEAVHRIVSEARESAITLETTNLEGVISASYSDVVKLVTAKGLVTNL